MEVRSLLDIIDIIHRWLRGTYVLLALMLLIMLGLVFFWSNNNLSTKSELEQQRVTRLLDRMRETLQQDLTPDYPGASTFSLHLRLDEQGVVKAADPLWLEGEQLQRTPLFQRLQAIPPGAQWLLFAPAPLTGQPAIVLARHQADQFDLVTAEDFSQLNTTRADLHSAVVDASGRVLYTASPKTFGQHISGSGLWWRDGHVFHLQRLALGVDNGLALVVVEDMSGLVLAVGLLSILVVLAIVVLNRRMRGLSGRLLGLRNEFDHIAQATYQLPLGRQPTNVERSRRPSGRPAPGLRPAARPQPPVR